MRPLGPLDVDQPCAKKQSMSPRERMLAHVMDRLAGIDVRRTFDLDGSGYVSPAVLRRSLATFDPQVFSEECIDMLLSRHSRPCSRCSLNGCSDQLVHIHDVFGPFWQPFCRRLHQLEEKVAQTKRQAQRRQVELAQTAQDTAEALRKAQLELRHPTLLSPASSDRPLRELKGRLEESEHERIRLEERLRTKEDSCHRKRAWREENDTMGLAQQLLAASEQTRRGLEAELRKCAAQLEQAERDKKQLQKNLADVQSEKAKGDSATVASMTEELAKVRKDNETLRAASSTERQEVQKLRDELEEQRQECQKQRQQLHDSSTKEEELQRELKQRADDAAKFQRQAAESMTQRLIEMEAEEQRRRNDVAEKKGLEARCVQLEEELIATRETMARREREAVEAVHHAVLRTRAEAEEQFQGQLGKVEMQLQSTESRLRQAQEDKEDLTAMVGKISEELGQLQHDLMDKQRQISETHDLSKARLEEQRQQLQEQQQRLQEQRQQLLEQVETQQKEFADRSEFLSGEVIRLKLEKGSLEQQLGQQSAEALRLGQESKTLEEQVSQARSNEAESKMEQERLNAELQLQRQLCQDTQTQLASLSKEAQELTREFSRRGLREDQLLDVSGHLQRLEEQMQEIRLQTSLASPASPVCTTELGTVELGKLEAELEAERSQKQMVETKLEEASRALASAQEQLAQKGWEAAQALAAVNDEMHQQRSASEGRHKALEEEVVLLKTKREELQAQVTKASVEKKELESQLQRSLQELMEQAAKIFDDQKSRSEEEAEMVKLREKLSAREDELVSVRSQVESLKKEVCSLEAKRLKEQLEASGAERDFSKQLATLKEDTVRQRCEERAKFDAEQQRLREEKDILQVRLEQLEGQAGQIDSDGLGEIELQELKDEKKEFHHQLQGVARDLTLTLRELESKTPGGECPKQVEATKQVLGHLQEQIATVCEELLIERPTARQKKAGQQKSRGSSEHASAALTAVSSENEQLQSACQQLKKDLEATEGELRSVRAELDEMLKVKDELTSENDALETKLQAAEDSSKAADDLASDRKSKALLEQEARIKELEEQLEETQHQLDQAQGELEQEQLDAAEALVSAGQDFDELEQKTDSKNRRLEAQLVEVTELLATAEETVEALTQELEQLRASSSAQLAENESKRKELEFHLEDTEQRLARAQDDLSQRSLDAAEALTQLGEELANVQAQSQKSETELRRLRSLLEDNSETSEQFAPQMILPEDRASPKSLTNTVHSSEGSLWS